MKSCRYRSNMLNNCISHLMFQIVYQFDSVDLLRSSSCYLQEKLMRTNLEIRKLFHVLGMALALILGGYDTDDY